MRLETDNQVRTAKCGGGSSYKDYSCGNNLQLRVTSTKKKTFRSRLKDSSGKVSIITLGLYPEITLSQARLRNQEAKDYFKQGFSIDRIKSAIEGNKSPATTKQNISNPNATKSGQTFQEFAEVWHANKTKNKEWSQEKVAKQNWSYLVNHAFPVLGRRPVEEITTTEVIEMLKRDDKWYNKHPTMKKVLRNTKQIFSLARSERYSIRNDNPAEISLDAEGLNTKHLEQPRGYFDYDRAPELYSKLANSNNIHHQCLLLILATAVRPENACEAEWSEFDLENERWVIPARKMKGRPDERQKYECWISPIVQDILNKRQELADGSKFIFASETKAGHVEHNSPARTLKRVIGKSHLDDWRGLDSDNTPVAHGIRHTFKTWASAHDYPDELSEAQSARSKRGVGARYNHDTSISDHRKEMMTKWDNFLRGVKSNG